MTALKDKILQFLPDFVVKLMIDIFVMISYNLNMDIKWLGIEHEHYGQITTQILDYHVENIFFPMDQSKRTCYSSCV